MILAMLGIGAAVFTTRTVVVCSAGVQYDMDDVKNT